MGSCQIPSFRLGGRHGTGRSTSELFPYMRPDCKQDRCKTEPKSSQRALFSDE
jgi:hypothetical protein